MLSEKVIHILDTIEEMYAFVRKRHFLKIAYISPSRALEQDQNFHLPTVFSWNNFAWLLKW